MNTFGRRTKLIISVLPLQANNEISSQISHNSANLSQKAVSISGKYCQVGGYIKFLTSWNFFSIFKIFPNETLMRLAVDISRQRVYLYFPLYIFQSHTFCVQRLFQIYHLSQESITSLSRSCLLLTLGI